MVEDLPLGFGQGPAAQPPMENWPPHLLGQPPTRSPWLAVAVAVTAVVAVAALIVALTREPNSHPSATANASVPSYTHARTATAQKQLCDTYKLAAHAVQVDTNGTDKALARIATTNAAVILESASADPAVDSQHRDAARGLATAYLTATVKATTGVAAEAEWQAALDDVVAKDAVMKQVCGGG
ncbi:MULTISPECIES: hypothetical protein [Mycobacterium]|uniref:hypothetical protein n=1 Tax=Mycobacterium TaxID=1763 RepID=UPI0009FF0FF5|nr:MULTISPECIES: hypothetical protein [Mycobacterium]WSE51553.1 hypothetical protein QGN31_00120 [Mycobacterium sp. 2-64]BCO54734.1 hypothetical protein MINTM003_51750 [Mycobacterium paraintracellulare]BCO92001.1 hypothetical protein MINTM015_52580 [Mycobacterium paraintracellulare]